MIICNEIKKARGIFITDLEFYIRDFCSFDISNMMSWYYNTFDFYSKLISSKNKDDIYDFIIKCHELLRRHELGYKPKNRESAETLTLAKNALSSIGGMDCNSDLSVIRKINFYKNTDAAASIVSFSIICMLIMCEVDNTILDNLMKIGKEYPNGLKELLALIGNDDLSSRLKFEYKLRYGVGLC